MSRLVSVFLFGLSITSAAFCESWVDVGADTEAGSLTHEHLDRLKKFNRSVVEQIKRKNH